MRESQVLAIKTSTAKAWGAFAFVVFAMLMFWGLLWVSISHSTSNTPYGPFLFLLFAAGLAPFGCLGAYLKVRHGSKIRYTLTPYGLTYPDLTDKVIPWEKIRKTKLRYMGFVIPNPSTPRAVIFLSVDERFLDSLEMSSSNEFARTFFYLFGIRGIWLSASGLEVSPERLLEIIDAYRQRCAALEPPDDDFKKWPEIAKTTVLQNYLCLVTPRAS
jgi:hypothetical protein